MPSGYGGHAVLVELLELLTDVDRLLLSLLLLELVRLSLLLLDDTLVSLRLVLVSLVQLRVLVQLLLLLFVSPATVQPLVIRSSLAWYAAALRSSSALPGLNR